MRDGRQRPRAGSGDGECRARRRCSRKDRPATRCATCSRTSPRSAIRSPSTGYSARTRRRGARLPARSRLGADGVVGPKTLAAVREGAAVRCSRRRRILAVAVARLCRAVPVARDLARLAPSWTRHGRSVNRLKSAAAPNEAMIRKCPANRKAPVPSRRPAGHSGPEDRACRRRRAAGPRLAKGGCRMIEITLRTKEALEAIRRVAGEVEEAIVGAGTILNASTVRRGGEGRLAIHRQPGPDDGTDLGRATAARCRCCPARSRRARSWPRAKPGSIS